MRPRVVPVPEGMDPTTAVMCQPVGTVLFACRRLGSVMGKRVAVLGQGAIGLTFTRLLASAGAKEIVGIDLLDERLAKAAEQGATATVNPMREDVVGAIAELTGGEGADVVVEAAGTEEAVDLLSSLVRPYGTLVLFRTAGTGPLPHRLRQAGPPPADDTPDGQRRRRRPRPRRPRGRGPGERRSAGRELAGDPPSAHG